VDVGRSGVTVRVNDEILVAQVPAPRPGKVGVAARSAEAGQVVFSWVRVWGQTPTSK